MKILISGGAGYVGSFLTKELLAQGHEVGVITQTPQQDSEIQYFTYAGDIQGLKDTFESFNPDRVIHLAADVSKSISSDTIDKMLNANIILPAHLLQLSEEYEVERLINISTFSTSIDGESYSPQTYYAATKKSAEDLATYYDMRTNLDIITLCFYDIYGANQPHARFLNSVINSVREQKDLIMSPGDQEICFLNVDDAVDAMIYALDFKPQNNSHIYCVHGSEVFKLKEVPHVVAEALGVPCPEIKHSMPYRDVEIMKFAPPHPLLEGWVAKTTLETEIIKML